ncbi:MULTISPECIES: hypothetical protein [Photorhabdus]|uniref:Uncharacterized protein n=1 Tax=Photorhabdus thracensis TaxID=230089 RepID=A0A0F7LTP7_9GAMM|nr:hypothetical protein [Photorhabdus thracensis]AKH65266.1 hypothetical protein VY86_19840 [Photorhabdus thracensis]
MPNNRVTYRADTRPPEQIFNTGFLPRFPGGVKIQEGGQMIGGISTSKELSIAMNYAALYEGYVYAVRANGVDLLEYFVRINAPSGVIRNATTQMEIACERILAKDVLAARKVLISGNKRVFSGELYINPLAAEAPELQIIRMLMSSDIAVCEPSFHS